MKKRISVLLVCLLVCCSLFVTACGGGASGKSVATIKSAFEAEGYIVESSTVANVSALVGIKGTNTISIMFFPDKDSATSAFQTYKTSAEMLGQTCKQDGNIIYYGSSAAMAVYESIS